MASAQRVCRGLWCDSAVAFVLSSSHGAGIRRKCDRAGLSCFLAGRALVLQGNASWLGGVTGHCYSYLAGNSLEEKSLRGGRAEANPVAVAGVGSSRAELAVAADAAGITAFRAVKSSQPAALLNLIVRRRLPFPVLFAGSE